jgi:hypothetical protein
MESSQLSSSNRCDDDISLTKNQLGKRIPATVSTHTHRLHSKDSELVRFIPSSAAATLSPQCPASLPRWIPSRVRVGIGFVRGLNSEDNPSSGFLVPVLAHALDPAAVNELYNKHHP